MAVFELTQAQWLRLDPLANAAWTDVAPAVVSNGSHGDAYPAFNLMADDLSTALAAFNPSSGARLAIPTSVQWRTAVGAASGYAWGAQPDRANLVAQAVVRETALTSARLASSTTQIDAGGPSEVGSKSPSGRGFYDLHGNVWEWVDGGTRVLGGSWFHPAALAAAEVSAGSAQGLLPDVDHALIGARLVLIP
jgi:formylglycine-generating enzyme required for sulfatase activity